VHENNERIDEHPVYCEVQDRQRNLIMHKLLITVTFFALIAAFAGCTHQPHSKSAVLKDLTPNMDGLSETYAENDAGIVVVNNANDRMFVDDMRRATLLDKPSMLSPYPVVDH